VTAVLRSVFRAPSAVADRRYREWQRFHTASSLKMISRFRWCAGGHCPPAHGRDGETSRVPDLPQRGYGIQPRVVPRSGNYPGKASRKFNNPDGVGRFAPRRRSQTAATAKARPPLPGHG